MSNKMKKYYSYTFIALAITLVGSTIARAEETTAPSNDVKVRAGVILRDKTRADIKAEVKTRELTQAQLLEARNKLNAANRASTTMEMRNIMKNSSTTMEERRGIREEMRIYIFNARKNAFIRQLQVSISNLVQISGRISSRIDKAVAEGRNMTEAKALLVTANAKIEVAKVAVKAFADYSPSTNTNASSTTSVSTTSTDTSVTITDLKKPRELVNAANKAIKEAHRALVDVVVSIAHNMGLKTGQASSTNSTSTQ